VESYSEPLFLALVENGILWAVGID
jgi:hypothetical protein